MASKSASVGGVLRREITLARYDPYAATGNKKYDDMKEAAIRLGIDLSLCVAESMFLLCDDMKNMLLFCCMIFRVVKPEENPVSERLLRVMHHVYTNDIITNNRVHQDKICSISVHCGLIGNAWKDFAYGIRFLHRLVMLLRRIGGDHRIATLDTADCKRQMLKKLEDKLRSAKDASEANGFSRETTESNISEMWKSLFDEEEEADAGRAKATKTRLLCNLFQPLFGESWQPNWGRHNEVFTPLPLYTIGKDFAKQERLREEAVRLGVELSLYVAESMFLLCDDIRSVLVFCNMLWRAVEKDLNQPHDSHVVEGLLRVFHYVYSKHIKPKSGVFQNGGTSVHWKLAMTFFEDFHAAIRGLDVFLREGSPECSIEEALKKVEEKLKFAKAVSEANGFVRDAMESDILVMWKSLFDKPTEDLWALKMMRLGILNDLFRPLVKERAEAKH